MKKKYHLYVILTCITIFIVIISSGIIYSLFENQPKIESTMGRGLIHISYDDVYLILEDLSNNQDRYESIFQNKMLFLLKILHDTTGASFTLYVYEYAGKYSITDVPDKWKSEFEENSEWLKFGYHGICPEISCLDENISIDDFKNSYQTVENSIIFFAGHKSLSNILRLSYFSGTDDIIDYLSKSGIKVLLTADDTRLNYNLNFEENNLINQDEILQKGDLTYVKTDIRYENTPDIEQALVNNSGEPIIVLFTHEWAFKETFCDVGKSAYVLSKSGRVFV